MKAKLLTAIAGTNNGVFFAFDSGQIVTENDLPPQTLSNLCKSNQAEPIAKRPGRKPKAESKTVEQ